MTGWFRPLTRALLKATALTVGATVAASLAGCSAFDTGNSHMVWQGAKPLETHPVRVPVFAAKPGMPALTAAVLAHRIDPAGHYQPAKATTAGTTEMSAKDALVVVTQTPYGTAVKWFHTCASVTGDPATAIAGTKAVFAKIGGNPAAYRWFTFTDASGKFRVLGEPYIDGHPSWTAGSFSALVDRDGHACSAYGTLLRFARTGTKQIESADGVFEAARHTPGRVIPGQYTKAEPTWTLDTGGKVIPGWRFVAKDKAIVSVRFSGEKTWETALDSESYLRQSAKSAASKAANKASGPSGQ